MIRLPALPVAIVASVAFLPMQASCQSSPYSLSLQQRFDHLSNVLQTDTGAVSDLQSATTLSLGLDQPIGRQRIFGSLSASAIRYQDRTQLNNDSYSLRAGWEGSTANRLSGSLTADASQALGEFAPAGLPSSAERNVVKSSGLVATVRLGDVTRLTTNATLSHRSVRNSNPVYASRDLDSDEATLGIRYRIGGAANAGMALRVTRGEYPSYLVFGGQTLGETFRRRNIDLTGDWQPSGASRLNGRVSVGRDTFRSDSTRDFSGLTYDVNWSWQATGKVSLTTTLAREAGDESGPTGTGESFLLNNSVSRVRNSVSLAGSYALSAKIGLRAGVSLSSATVVSPNSGLTGREKTQRFSLGATWDPTRTVRVGCDFSRDSRDASALATAYDADVFGCFAQLTLR